MEAKFTKDWHIKYVLILNSDNKVICRVFDKSQSKLIAAAPEMYELLKKLLDTCGFVNEAHETTTIELLNKINS